MNIGDVKTLTVSKMLQSGGTAEVGGDEQVACSCNDPSVTVERIDAKSFKVEGVAVGSYAIHFELNGLTCVAEGSVGDPVIGIGVVES